VIILLKNIVEVKEKASLLCHTFLQGQLCLVKDSLRLANAPGLDELRLYI
jgi:hypothetical protein